MSRFVIGVLTVLLTATALAAQEPPRADGWVVLSLDEYRALRARAFPTPADPSPPPVDATLTRVDYELRVGGDTVTGQARLAFDVLKQGWVSVQAPAGVLVRDARIEGRPITLVDGNPPRVLLSRTGRSTLTLDIVVPLAAAAGTESIALPPSGSAVSAVTLVIPRTSVDLTVAGGFIAEHAENAGETRWVVYGNAGRGLTFSWKRRADDRRSTLPLRTRARITELVALGEDASQVTASVRLEVTQGAARDATVSLPEGLIVNQVAGGEVADWTVSPGSLRIVFLEPVTAEVQFVVSAEIRTPREGTIAIPLVRVPAAERETGGIAVDVVGAGEIARHQPRALEPSDPADLGDIIAGKESASMVAFKYTAMSGAAPRALSVDVSRYTSQAVLVANVEEARYDALVGEDGKVLVRARYAVRNNQRAFLAVVLPARATLWSALLSDRPVRPGLSADGALLLPLEKGRSSTEAPTFRLELVYLHNIPAWRNEGEAHLELPALDLPVSRTGLSLHHSPRFRIDARPGAFRTEQDRGPWHAVLRSGGAPFAVAETGPAPRGAAENDASKDLEGLLDRFKKEAGRTRTGTIPIRVEFPELGPSIFLAAELTAEMRPASLDLKYRKDSE
ncbi:MAG: hypothetical protein WBC51_27585 [Vicinamibacterales bacterium]